MRHPRLRLLWLPGLLLALSAGCQGQKPAVKKSRSRQVPAEVQLARIGESIRQADLSVLFIGNSHTGPLPREISLLNQQRNPDRVLFIRRPPSSGFLADHANMQDTRDLIQAGPWDYVVLQGQKYSTTGKYQYPRDGALELSRLAQQAGARVIMYPEWSRRDAPDEYLRIDRIHHEIASQTAAIVAPVGKAWNLAIQEFPEVRFHAADGNHAAPHGNYLTACVFYGLLTGESPVEGASEPLQKRLAGIAWELTKELAKDQSKRSQDHAEN